MQPVTFTSLYEQYAPDVHRFVCYLTANRTLADDILAETFFRAWTRRDKIQAATAKSYLIAIARNLVTDHFRIRDREAPLDFDTSTPAGNPDTKLLLDRTMLAIQQLDERYRAPLVMHCISGIAYEEIARCLDIPLGTVKVRIHRARLQLNTLLDLETTHEATR